MRLCLRCFWNPQSTPLLFCPPNLLCLSTPISINTFPTKFSQQSQSLALSPTLGLRHHSTDSLPTPQSLFFNLCWILLSLHFSFLTLLTAPMSTFTSKMEISTMFWKLQLRLLFHIQISTRMCTDTSSFIFLALIFTLRFLLLLRCHIIHLLLKLEFQAWSLSLPSLKPDLQVMSVLLYKKRLHFSPLFQISLVQALLVSQVITALGSELIFLMPIIPSSLQFYLHMSISQVWEVTDFQEHFPNSEAYSLHPRNLAAKVSYFSSGDDVWLMQ